MEPEQLSEEIHSFTLDTGTRGNQGYTRVLLQLFGATGHGKSSFINSCKYVLEEGEKLIPYAEAGERTDGGAMTTVRKAFDLTENITMVDNRGYNTMNSFQRAEIYAQLGNFIPIGEQVTWVDNYTDMMTRLEDAELDPNYSDFIVPILIYSAVCGLSNRDEVKTFMDNCVKMTGVVPIIVITRKTSGDYIEVKKQFKLMGAEIVIAIENYTNEDHIKTHGRTTDILTILHLALKHVAFRLKQERNPRRDWIQRKKFLLDYIHQADLEKRDQQRRREEDQRRRADDRRRDEEKRREEQRRAEESKKNWWWPF